MHFLCLHGLGTNSQILEAQTAALRYELGDLHTYDYVEGTIKCPIAPEIALHSSDSDDYFAYFDPQTPTTFVTALDNLEAFISQNGPYDAVLAYSHGAQLVASMLARLHTRSPLAQPFKCAVFLSGGIPYELVTLSSGVEKISFISPEERESLIHIPTANIWGGRDVLYPGHSKVLSKLCRADWNTEFVHTGGHEIPGAKTKNDLLGCVKAIQKTMDKALNSH